MRNLLKFGIFCSWCLYSTSIWGAAPKADHNKAQPASSRPTTRPSSRATTRPSASKPSIPPKIKPFFPKASPKRTGWLSIALSGQEKVWIDGHFAGIAPASYIRVSAGTHIIRIEHKIRGVKQFTLRVPANRHSSLGLQKNGKLGFYYVRGAESEVQVYLYPKQGGQPYINHRSPGPFCPHSKPPKRCIFLTPGEKLYVQSDGQTILLPSQRTRLASRPFPIYPNAGKLTIYSYPPGALFLNGKLYTLTPISQISLKAGHYKMWIRNGFLNLEYRGTFTIKPNQTIRKVVYLSPKKGGTLAVTSSYPAQIFLDGQYRGWTPARVLPLSVGIHKLKLHFPNGKKMEMRPTIRKNQHTKIVLP